MLPSWPALTRLIETQAAAAEVIMRRIGMMWLAPMSTGAQRETLRMVAEKQAAAAEAAFAFSAAMMEEAAKFWTGAVFRPFSPFPVEKSVARSLRRAATPLTRRVRDNRRRLRR
jgi:hypothetical protein